MLGIDVEPLNRAVNIGEVQSISTFDIVGS